MADTARKIRILVVDDHALFRESIARLLNTEPDFQVAGECGSVKEALEIVSRNPIDVVLLDYDLGEECGSKFLPLARERGFSGRVLVVTAGVRIHEQEASMLIRQGVAGLFLKHHPPATLSLAIRTIMEGEVWLEQRYLAALLRTSTPQEEEKTRLTEREVQVLRCVFEGLANKEIADRLHVSESAVKATLQQLFNKTGVRTRSQLVRVALEKYQEQL